jgi:hypothetical protein
MGGLMTSNDDILLMLGRVEEGVKRIREDFQEEKENAHDSRAVIHRRLDEQMRQINLLDKVVEISSGVDATLREEIKALKETVDRNHASVQPTIEEWKKLKIVGSSISGLIALSGLTAGTIIAVYGKAVIVSALAWLKGL